MVVLRGKRIVAGAALLAALGLTNQSRLLAQGIELPPVGAPVPVQMAPASPAPAATTQAAPVIVAPGTALPTSPQPIILDGPVVQPGGVLAAPAPAGQPAGDGSCAACKDGASDYWAKSPPITPFPRPGFFNVWPSGPGYYSVADVLHDNCRQGPPKYPYPVISPFQWSFFDADWRYLDDPKNTEHDYADGLKRQRFGPNDMFLFSTGGELRGRFDYEKNGQRSNQPNLPRRVRGIDDPYDLYRARVYTDLMITNRFRVYAEFISALNPDYRVPPLVIDRDPGDLLNLFAEISPLDINDAPVWIRIGRQELLFGSQRLISPLDWANTRRTFQGIKAYWHSESDWLDAFLVQPVLPNRYEFDWVDNNVTFAGLWYTHRFGKASSFDLYYLMLDDTTRSAVGENGVRGVKTVHTWGARSAGIKDNWMWDLEAMVQGGDFSNQSLFAHAITTGAGYDFKDAWGTPQLWLYYDYASGDPTPGKGNLHQTFEQLFPFGHYYFGWLDLVGRKNINDFSAYMTVFPTKWMFTQVQVHNFYLDSGRDALYGANGVALRQDKTGRAGKHVGQELDFIVNFHLSNHSDLLFNYSHMFAGSFLKRTATNSYQAMDPQAFYVQYSYRW
ncbi:MAG: alginate export family protein [Gemmataceae bacterium]